MSDSRSRRAGPTVAICSRKKTTRLSTSGFEVQSFKILLDELATLGRHTCCLANDTEGPTFEQETEPSALHARVFELLEL